MNVEYEKLEMPMDLKLKWVKTKLHERDKHIAKLAEENSKLREDLREDIRKGISLRDHFAGLAMQTLPKNIPDMETLARLSYNMADAMLEEREKNGQ